MRLVGIHIRDFRAFQGNFTLELKNGSNLLLHGENGSGKSSLALALREFLTLETPFPRPIGPYSNIFADPASCRPLVQLSFSEGASKEDILWQGEFCHPLELGTAFPTSTTKEQREKLMTVSRRSGFFDYRALLRASLASRSDALREQLFLLFVENLLSGFPVTVAGTERSLGELWSELKRTTPRSRRESHMTSANFIAKRFDGAFAPFLNQLMNKANEYLAYFPNHRMKISFDYPGSSFATVTKLLTGKAVIPIIDFNGKKVDSHQEFLNEARLTALALSVFLAAVKLADADPNNPEALRLLVLDDVLIGLDLNNRLPLLELLGGQFPHHQILLLTHDPVWFEIAKEHISSSANWTYARLFEEPTGPAEPYYPRFERMRPNQDDLQVAEGYLHAGDLRAAAVYIRAAYESRLKNISEAHGIQVSYKKNQKDLKIDALWRGILERHVRQTKTGGEFLDPKIIPRISAVRSIVLNRMSHSGASSLTHGELEAALKVIQDLRSIKIPFKK